MSEFKITLWLSLVTFAGWAHSHSWTPLWQEPEHLRLVDEPPHAIGQKIIFKAFDANHVALWSYDDQSKQTNLLVPSMADRTIRQLTPYQGLLYFIVDDSLLGHGTKLWRTDGTSQGTHAVSDINFFRGFGSNYELYEHHGVLYGYGDEGTVLTFDGEDVTVVGGPELFSVDISRMCVFSDRDFIIYDHFDEDRTLVRSTEGLESDLTDAIPLGFRLQQMFLHNQNCYLQVKQGSAFNAPVDVVKITPTGAISRFSDNPLLANINELFIHQGELFAVQIGTDENNTGSLLRLHGNTPTPEVLLALPDGRFKEHRSLNNGQLFVHFSGNSYQNHQAYYLDTDLQPQVVARNEPYYRNIEPLSDGNSAALVFVEDRTLNPSNDFEIDLFEASLPLKSLRSDGYRFIHAVQAENAAGLYFVLRDLSNGQTGFYTLSEQPAIGQSLSGLWVAPNLNNQGLSIRQGRRQQGSEYIFTTLYTFRDGDPLWLAGVADYQPNQVAIEMDLFEYRGTQFLQLIEAPTATTFGRIRLQMTDCDRLQVTIEHGPQSADFSMQRIANTRHRNACLQPVDR